MATRYDYTVSVEAASQEEADRVIEARIGHDEDLRKDRVDEYAIYFTERDDTDPTLPVRSHGYGESPAH